jgi:uncharacterized protein (UPF0332 family)
LPFSWGDFLTCAESLLKNGDEASRRTAISRSYYAAYHGARIYVTAVHGAELGRNHQAHKQVCEELRATNRTPEQRLAADLEQLRNQRVKADYRTRFQGNLKREAEFALTTARSMWDRYDTLFNG